MTEQEVIALMESSNSVAEWERNCNTVKSRCKSYPIFWFPAIIESGLADRVLAKFGASTEITFTPIGKDS